MPIYEYRCNECNNTFESLRLMRDADLQINCSRCSSTNTHRIQSACYSKISGNGSINSQTSGCSGCSGGSCSSCSH